MEVVHKGAVRALGAESCARSPPSLSFSREPSRRALIGAPTALSASRAAAPPRPVLAARRGRARELRDTPFEHRRR
jgi:hypothetical protein